jgi:hypothetical protein
MRGVRVLVDVENSIEGSSLLYKKSQLEATSREKKNKLESKASSLEGYCNTKAQ